MCVFPFSHGGLASTPSSEAYCGQYQRKCISTTHCNNIHACAASRIPLCTRKILAVEIARTETGWGDCGPGCYAAAGYFALVHLISGHAIGRCTQLLKPPIGCGMLRAAAGYPGSMLPVYLEEFVVCKPPEEWCFNRDASVEGCKVSNGCCLRCECLQIAAAATPLKCAMKLNAPQPRAGMAWEFARTQFQANSYHVCGHCQ